MAVLTNREAPAETTPFIELHDSVNEVTASASAGVMMAVSASNPSLIYASNGMASGSYCYDCRRRRQPPAAWP